MQPAHPPAPSQFGNILHPLQRGVSPSLPSQGMLTSQLETAPVLTGQGHGSGYPWCPINSTPVLLSTH